MNIQKKYSDYWLKIHRCKSCTYVYVDEEQKIPFKEVGNEWRCPKCRSSKNFFVEKEIP